jgi:hypothetical protein
MSLSDPLTLLREFTMGKKPITLEGEYVVFGDVRFERTAKTAYRQGGGAESGEYYQIDALWALLQMGDKTADYVKFCGDNRIKTTHITDRRTLLKYLRGEVADAKNIDYSKYEGVQATRVEAATSAAAADASQPAGAAEAAAGKAAVKKELTAEELKAIDEARKAFLRVLEQPIGVPRAVGDDDDEPPPAAAPVAAADAPAADAPPADLDAGAGDAVPGAPAAGASEGASKREKERLKEAILEAKPFIRHDREASSAIAAREVHMRTRQSVLVAPGADKFPVVMSLLKGFEERAKRLKRAPEAMESARKQPRPSSSAPAPQPSSGHAPTSRPPATLSRSAAGAPQAKGGLELSKGGGKPAAVLVVPSAITAMVNMLNIQGLLERSEFVPAEERKGTTGPHRIRSLPMPGATPTPDLHPERASPCPVLSGGRHEGVVHLRRARLWRRHVCAAARDRQPGAQAWPRAVGECRRVRRPGIDVAVQGLALQGRGRDLYQALVAAPTRQLWPCPPSPTPPHGARFVR